MALGAAFITIHADTAPFAKELNREVRGILKATEGSTKGDSESLGRSISDGIGNGIKKNSKKIGSSVRDALNPDDDDSNRVRNKFLKLGSEAIGFFGKGLSAGGNALASGLETSVKGLGNLLGSVFNVSVTSLPAAAALVATFLFAATVVIPMLVSAVIALAGALSNLLGLLLVVPSAFGVALAIVLPLVAAFQGFGEAISAVLSKDPKKIAEALKGLTPAARSVVKEFQALMPFFSKLADIAQQAFFAPLVGDLTALIKRASLPLLDGFKNVAGAAGNLVSGILAALSRPEMVIFFDDLFDAATTALETLRQPIIDLVMAFAAMAQAAMPTFLLLITALGDFITRFAAWIQDSIADGSFQGFLDKAVATLKDVKDLISAVIQLFAVMFAGTESGGRTFLELVTQAVEKLTAFFESKRGQKALQGMIDLAIIFGLLVYGLIRSFQILAGVIENVASTLRTIIKLISGIDIRKLNPGPVIGGKIPGLASGGIISSPTLALVGEGQGPEVVIPLADRNRAQELADQSGLSSMLRSGGQNISLTVYIGNEQVEAYVERRVDSAFAAQSRSLTYGARTGV